jgi:excisionase family DNA binding protein
MQTVSRLLTVKEAAAYLRVSTWTIRRWIKDHLLDYVRIGREYRIVPDSLPKFPVVELKKTQKSGEK